MSKKHLIQFIKVGLYLILLTPLIFSRSLVFPFATLKVFVFHSLIEIIFALWLGLIIFSKEHRPRLTLLTKVLAVFFIVLIVSSVFGIDWSRSLWSTQDRMLGLVSLLHFGALFLILRSLWRELKWKNYLFFSFGVSSVVAFFTVAIGLRLIDAMDAYKWFLSGYFRPGTFFGNPSFTAVYLLFHIFIGIWLFFEFFRERKKILSFLTALFVFLNIFGVFFTETRGAILGLLAGILFLLFFFSFGKEKFLRKISVCLLILIFLSGVVFWFTQSSSFWRKVPGIGREIISASSFRTADLAPRLITLKAGWESFLERPILGFGFENFRYPFDRHYDPRLLRFNFEATYFDKPHNIFLEYLVNNGILGLLAYLGVFAAAFYLMFKKPLQHSSMFMAAALITYLVQNLFLFDTFGSYLMLFIILAFIDSQFNKPLINADKNLINADNQHKSAKISVNQRLLKRISIVVLLLISAATIYFINYPILYANNRQYWGLNYFLNRMPEPALGAYAQSLTISNPYIDDARKEFTSSLSQAYTQGINIPDIENVSAKAMSELALAINRHPNDYFLRLTFVNASADFYVFNPAYLQVGEQQAEQALKLSPKRQEIFYALAQIKLIKGEKKSAFELMKRAVELDPLAADPHFFYGLTLFEAGEKEIGFAEIERAKELGREPRDNGEARVLGNYYGDAGDYGKAISMYLTAVSHNSDDLDAQLKLGIVYFYSGDRDNARLHIEKVLVALPEFKKSAAFETVKSIIENLGL